LNLSFEETLAALLGLIGEPVEIKLTVGGKGQPSITVGFMSGRLQRAMNRGPAVMPDLEAGPEEWNDHDAHFFVVGDDDGTGFYLAPQAFESARWLSPTQHDLWIEQGPYLVVSVIAPSRVAKK
jgi:hypothetical protein